MQSLSYQGCHHSKYENVVLQVMYGITVKYAANDTIS